MATNITKIKHRFPLREIRRFPKFLSRTWPIFALILFGFLIAFLNYEPGTYLMGWDNLMPELAPTLNLKRSLFSVWQEYQSLGLLGGMAHAADLPRVVLIFLLSAFTPLPISLFRYLFTFLPLLLGPLGVYFFLYHRLFKNKLDSRTSQSASFLGGLFYLFNLSTLQNFFTPFESFTFFYGTFPWLLFFITDYLERPNKKSLLIIFIMSLISAPSFYVETIFLVFFLCLFPFFVEIFFAAKNKIKPLKKILKTISSVTIPNLFWLLPVIFFVLTNGRVGTQAKINLITSPETYSRNLDFGNLNSLALLKGFWFNFLDLGANNNFDYLLSVWRTHLNTPIIAFLGYSFFVLILIGLYYSFKKKFPWVISLAGILAISLFFLVGGGLLVNGSIPLLGEIFRSPFTKFSTPLSFVYSCFFAVGTVFLLDIFSFLHSRFTYYLTLFTVAVSLLIFMSPAFSGNLVSSNMRLSLPSEYTDLFSFMKTQDPNTRIANFPQYTFWGWNYYDWGYRGSGFLWYGLKQPILDRAFDVWDKDSEQYYEEISTALFSDNQKQFESLIDKYNVNWILVDKHVIVPDGRTDTGNTTLQKFLTSSSKFSLVKNFNDKILLYQTDVSQKSKNFLSVLAPNVATGEVGSDPSKISHPFANLSLRPNTDWIDKDNLLSIATALEPDTQNLQSLHIPSLTASEKLLPVKVDYQKNVTDITFRLTPITPTLFANTDQIDLDAKPTFISLPLDSLSKNYILQLNNQYLSFDIPGELDNFTDYFPLATLYLPTQKYFTVALFDGSENNEISLTDILSQSKPAQCYVQKPNRKIEKIVTTDSISLLGTDVVGCLSTPLPNIARNSLISFSFTYSSATLLTANVNISGPDFGAETVSQPLEPSTTPKRVRTFTKSTVSHPQINLLLEAADTKSVQEITYRDISISTHPLISSTQSTLLDIPEKVLAVTKDLNYLQVTFPTTSSQFDIRQIAESNSLFPESRNCDQFNQGSVTKQKTSDGLLYQSQNAIECDQLNLRQLDHSLNYLMSFNYEFQRGLPMTVCLENYTTHRCDIFERLINSQTIQSIIQPIANSNESLGYTLHLFNQSVGRQITTNLLKSLVIRPIPLNFLQNISLSQSTNDTVGAIHESPTNSIISTHPAELLYTATINSDSSVIPGTDPESIQITPILNLSQTKSPYWQALQVSEKDLTLPSWLLTLKVFFAYPFLTKLPHNDSTLWHNSWNLSNCNLSSNNCHLVLIYLPQYLEFLGLVLIPLSLFLVIAIPPWRGWQSIKIKQPKN